MQASTRLPSVGFEAIRTPADRLEATASSANSKNSSAAESARCLSEDQRKSEAKVKIKRENRWLSLIKIVAVATDVRRAISVTVIKT